MASPTLARSTDVNLSSLSNLQTLIYNSNNSQWNNSNQNLFATELIQFINVSMLSGGYYISSGIFNSFVVDQTNMTLNSYDLLPTGLSSNGLYTFYTQITGRFFKRTYRGCPT